MYQTQFISWQKAPYLLFRYLTTSPSLADWILQSWPDDLKEISFFFSENNLTVHFHHNFICKYLSTSHILMNLSLPVPTFSLHSQKTSSIKLLLYSLPCISTLTVLPLDDALFFNVAPTPKPGNSKGFGWLEGWWGIQKSLGSFKGYPLSFPMDGQWERGCLWRWAKRSQNATSFRGHCSAERCSFTVFWC